jgi:hypothetical protein
MVLDSTLMLTIVILGIKVMLLMDAMLTAQSKMGGIAMAVMTQTKTAVMKFAVTLITLETLIAMIATLIVGMAAHLVVRLKTAGTAIFQQEEDYHRIPTLATLFAMKFVEILTTITTSETMLAKTATLTMMTVAQAVVS